MKTQTRNTVLGLLVATVVTTCSATATFAFPGQQPRVRPEVVPPVVTPVVPRLGIMGHIEFGWGMSVDAVVRGTAASRIGLERGDVILRINGQEITSDQAYRQALLNAVRFENGLLKMQIADVRSGRRVFRTGFLHANPGVILPRTADRDADFDHHDHSHFDDDHDHHHDHGHHHNHTLSKNFRSTEW